VNLDLESPFVEQMGQEARMIPNAILKWWFAVWSLFAQSNFNSDFLMKQEVFNRDFG
jgi:hypothetical protein